MHSIYRFRATALIVAMAALAACGSGSKQTVTPAPPAQSVFYTYPDADQTGVSTRIPMVVRFSGAVSIDAADVTLVSDGEAVPVTVETVGEGRSVVVRPEGKLDFNTRYALSMPGLPDGSLDFTTGPATKGPRSQQITAEEFAVTRMVPDGDSLPIVDFSALRVQLSQPVDVATIRYGHDISLRTEGGDLVPATLLAKGHFLTIDPDENLAPGVPHTLTIESSVRSIYDAPLVTMSRTFTPLDSGPNETLVLEAPASGELSQLTGQTVNLVPVIAALLGDDTESQQEGLVFSQLAFVPNFPDVTPLRIAKGGMLSGDELVVNVGGAVDAGFNSGTVTVEFISDAVGFLSPNPYSTNPQAPRQLRVLMDIAIATGDAEANAAFNQDVLHLELVGQAVVENGRLVADALTVVESEVLGVETAFGTLSFRMEGLLDQENAPGPLPDMRELALQSWMPGNNVPPFQDNVDKQRPGDPIVLNFTKALDRKTLALGGVDPRIALRRAGMDVPYTAYFDGVSLVINADLEYGETYDVVLRDGITDIAGTPLMPQTLTFTMEEYVRDVPLASPLALNVYPGYPCALNTDERNLSAGITGRCDGAMASDDLLPVPQMPANRSIEVRFSQVMNLDSFTLTDGDNAGSVTVERLNEDGSVAGLVSGRLETRARGMVFTPDQPWEIGALYQYTLRSNGESRASTCVPEEMICSQDGLPLRTRLFAQTPSAAPTLDGGGPDLQIAFRGAPEVDWARIILGNLPTADVNSNTLRDPGEDNGIDNPELLKNSAAVEVVGVDDMVVTDAELQCGQDNAGNDLEQCLIYLTGGIDTDVVGFFDAEQAEAVARTPVPPVVTAAGGGVLVYLYPTQLQTSNIVVDATSAIGEAAPADTGPMTLRVRYACDARTSGAPQPPNAAPIRQCEDGEAGLVEGWIFEGASGTEFATALNLYIDSPALDPRVNILALDALPDNLANAIGQVPVLGDLVGGLLGLLSPVTDPVLGTVSDVIAAITSILPEGADPTAVPLEHNQRSYGFALDLLGPVEFYDDGRLEVGLLSQGLVALDVELVALGFLEAEVNLEIPFNGANLNYTSGAIKR
ncbi:Ig-like domain-containing protein [Alcanivorax sp. JB21]|uniref:Ig-like domain-containing protein n=1 Tax=Alcanivorax limicola TaxID=2874102 RepID=UPI001CC15E55|nr:Ig-like domain-containing protein [Alcanivorax limicola]MBZ2189166.1 Ig-like domain-containing protein [Alcanivorax limicola]